jgi:protein-tyrosine phosphatase
MAEALMKDHLKRMGLQEKVLVSSAGTWAEDGHPATAFGIKAMAERGLNTSFHRSQALTQELMEQFDLVLTMETGHKEAIQIEFPMYADKVFMLSEMSSQIKNIEDPIGGSFEDYLETAREIDEWIKTGFKHIIKLLQLEA